MKHLTALDGIRAIALFLVIVSHWLDKSYLVQAVAPGAIGVDVFFVLSGFLITTILLQNRLQAEALGNSKSVLIKSFFIRRSLRIFPIYYLFVAACFVIGPITGTNIRQHALYFLTYTSNFYFYQQQAWDGIVSHLWSLAVEEQFYLLWPWVMVFTPRRYLLVAILLFIGVGVGSGYVIASKNLGDFALTLPFSCFDAFGLGALLAFVWVFHKNRLALASRILGIAAIICGVQALSMQTPWPLVLLPDRTVYALIGLWLIARVVLAQETNQKPSVLLANPVLVFIGKISYGMYLYHLPLAWDSSLLYACLNHRLPAVVMPYLAYIVFAENMVLLVALAWASWLVVERPMLRFKQYFDYQAHEPAPVASVGA
jgi:peptidoglycan/LPS O-acetylase OafA/YrhL